jgi:hypothetical protein
LLRRLTDVGLWQIVTTSYLRGIVILGGDVSQENYTSTSRNLQSESSCKRKDMMSYSTFEQGPRQEEHRQQTGELGGHEELMKDFRVVSALAERRLSKCKRINQENERQGPGEPPP